MTNWRRVPEDHDPAARSRTVVPDAMMRAMYVLAIRGISFSPAAQTRNWIDYCEFSTVPAELPHTTELPQTTEFPQTTEESATSETVLVDALYVTVGDLAEPTFAGARSVLASAAEASTAPAPTEKRSCSIW